MMSRLTNLKQVSSKQRAIASYLVILISAGSHLPSITSSFLTCNFVNCHWLAWQFKNISLLTGRDRIRELSWSIYLFIILFSIVETLQSNAFRFGSIQFTQIVSWPHCVCSRNPFNAAVGGSDWWNLERDAHRANPANFPLINSEGLVCLGHSCPRGPTTFLLMALGSFPRPVVFILFFWCLHAAHCSIIHHHKHTFTSIYFHFCSFYRSHTLICEAFVRHLAPYQTPPLSLTPSFYWLPSRAELA